jgi:hypothetical protein
MEMHPKNKPRTRLIANFMDKDENIKMPWVPAHRGITGNEKLDQAAKESLDLEVTRNSKISANDLIKNSVTTRTRQRQTKWKETTNPMKLLKPDIQRYDVTAHLNRQEQVVITRLRTGYSYLTHAHRINLPPP